ncbi:unnamed protein product [Toxocara canis]|uniref:PGG domain-containing protein n=1 Tax=Toxocara canis TaxID=6265 RepID=A0A183V6D0_TOXCA|nr:unnamed protein product [Toxocara canis]
MSLEAPEDAQDIGLVYAFHDNNAKYLAICQRVHIRWLTIAFVTIQCAMVAYFVISKALTSEDSIVTIASVILLGVALLTCALLIIGILKKAYTFVIPYFTLCILVIFMVSMKFLVDILDLINERKQSLRQHVFELVAEV